MKKWSVIVRVEYEFEVEAEDQESAEERARELYHRGSLRLATAAEVDSVEAAEAGP